MAAVGHNSEVLRGFIERIEQVRKDKKGLAADEALFAEAKAAGFVPSGMRNVLTRRAMKPHQRQEAESLLNTYLHALGEASDTPLFRQVGLMKIDIAARDQVIEALKTFVPENGAIVIEAGGTPVRLTRDKEGTVTAADVVERPKAPKGDAPPAMPAAAPREPPPDVDEEGAERLGAQAFKDDKPIIDNPFPFGDARRPRWDQGWRTESGSDGMGPGGGEP
jgi:uncharacterized protein (UPF0335 family)